MHISVKANNELYSVVAWSEISAKISKFRNWEIYDDSARTTKSVDSVYTIRERLLWLRTSFQQFLPKLCLGVCWELMLLCQSGQPRQSRLLQASLHDCLRTAQLVVSVSCSQVGCQRIRFKEDKTLSSCAVGDLSARLNGHDAFPGFEIDGIYLKATGLGLRTFVQSNARTRATKRWG